MPLKPRTLKFSLFYLRRLTCTISGSPCPLEIESSEMSGDVDHFADEVQSRNPAALHRLCGKFVGVDAARGHLGFAVTFRSVGNHVPLMYLPLQLGKAVIGPLRWCMRLHPAFGEARRQRSPQRGSRGSEIPAGRRLSQGPQHLALRRQIESNSLPSLPIGRDLQDCWTTQAAMCDQHLLPKSLPIYQRDYLR